ncbi:MAG: glycosyltransferase [Candidatus Lernaella stagnicola]|nr:glycosyltransferase [Candidatus Lernaella stagnicola]
MIKVLHVAEGARFAGIESHLVTMFSRLRGREDLHAELAVFAEGLLKEKTQAIGVSVHTISRRRKYDTRAIAYAARLIREGGFHLVHTHGYLANIIGGKAAMKAGVPFVTTVHGAAEPFHGWAGWKMRFNLALDRRMTRRHCARVITVAEPLKRQLMAAGMPKEKIDVIHNGLEEVVVDEAVRQAARATWHLTPEDRVVTFVGRLEVVKDPLLFVETAAQIAARVPRAVFRVAGDGPLLDAARARAKVLNLGESIRFLGFVDDVPSLVAASDLLLLTSRHEGIPNAALEAMRAGVALLAPAVGGLPELLKGLPQLLCHTREAQDLALRAANWLSHDEERVSLGQAGKHRFETAFTAATMVEKTVQVYRRVVENEP